MVRFEFADANFRIYRSDELALDLTEESDKTALRSGGEEGLASSQGTTDSERLHSIAAPFEEEDLLADTTKGEEVVEVDADVTMVEVKRTGSYEADPNKPPPFYARVCESFGPLGCRWT